jgi:L-ascorbate metabolism protein UlaG (beta-lactamase superfamily)
MELLILIIVTLIVLIVLFIIFAPQLGKRARGERLKRIIASPQWDIKEFKNDPIAIIRIGARQSIDYILETLRGGQNRQPKNKLPSQKVIFDSEAGAHLTWFGHSTFLYEIDGKKILFDPMLGKYASPVPFLVGRYAYDLPSSARELPHLDAVIISHDHYDHLDYGTIKILKDKTDRFIMPLGVGAHLERWGVAKEKITELDWWDKMILGDITITATPSQHFSGRALTDTRKTLWASWVIQNKTAKVFFGGDSGYFPGFKKIGETYGPFDLTLLDSGQYNEKWSVVHMNPEESVKAHCDLRGKVFMPIHWSAFTLAFHDWNEPPERALAAAEKEHIDIITPMIGQRFDVLNDRPKETWWKSIR